MITTTNLLKRYEGSSTELIPSVISEPQSDEADDGICFHSCTVIRRVYWIPTCVSSRGRVWVGNVRVGNPQVTLAIKVTLVAMVTLVTTANMTVFLTWVISMCGILTQPRKDMGNTSWWRRHPGHHDVNAKVIDPTQLRRHRCHSQRPNVKFLEMLCVHSLTCFVFPCTFLCRWRSYYRPIAHPKNPTKSSTKIHTLRINYESEQAREEI